MSSAANPSASNPPARRATKAPQAPRGRRQDDMAGQQQQTQDVVIDRLTDRLSAIFQPQLKDIKDQLANLITRREHEKDLTEVNADIAAQRRDFDRLQDWAEKRPRESADAQWVRRIEADVQSIMTRLANQPEGLRSNLATYGGCIGHALFAFISLVALLISVLSLAASHLIIR